MRGGRAEYEQALHFHLGWVEKRGGGGRGRGAEGVVEGAEGRTVSRCVFLVTRVASSGRGLFGAADDVVEEEEAAVFLKRMTTGQFHLREYPSP